MNKITIEGQTFFLSKERYMQGGANAITLYVYDGEIIPWIDVTTNITGTILGPDECLVKVWSENEPYISPLLKSGFFEDTGRRVKAGFVEAHIWKILKDIPGDESLFQK